MLKQIGTSILKTIIIAGLLAGVGTLFDFPFIQVFAATMCAQFVLFFIWNSVVEYLFRTNLQKQETELAAAYAQQGTDVNCAYCGKGNFVPIRFDEDNEFDCEQCDQTNAIYVRITTAQVTDILDGERVSASTYIKERLQVEDEQREKEEDETE